MFRPFLFVAGIAALILVSACDPVIPHDIPTTGIVANFDPAPADGGFPVVPAPNDLAFDPASGLLNIPTAPNASPAQIEFNAYLDTLDGFPVESIASESFSGNLDPTTINAGTVKIVDLTNPAAPQLFQPSAIGANSGSTITYAWDATNLQINVTAPWAPSHAYAVAIVGGPIGVRGAKGEAVIASTAMYFARAAQSLVTCPDSNPADCTSNTSLLTNAQATGLEPVRESLQPALAFLATQGVDRGNVAAVWTFHTASQPVATFNPNPASPTAAVPFPSDYLYNPTADAGAGNAPGLVSLPISPCPTDGGVVPGCDSATEAQLKAGLNMLDGFSSTAHIITSQNFGLGAATVPLDASSLSPNQFLLVNTASLGGVPEIVPVEVTCKGWCDPTNPYNTITLSDGGTGPNPKAEPDQISLRPLIPLRSHTRYAVIWIRGAAGTNAEVINANTTFALARLSNPLVDGSGHSTIVGVPDATAQQVAQLQGLLAPLMQIIDGLGAGLDFSRLDVVNAWTFITQTASPQGSQLRAYSYNPALGYPFTGTASGLPTGVLCPTGTSPPLAPCANAGQVNTIATSGGGLEPWDLTAVTGAGVPTSHLEWAQEGYFYSPDLMIPSVPDFQLALGPTTTEGYFNPSSPRIEGRKFTLFAPDATYVQAVYAAHSFACGGGGEPVCPVPVVVFQHGLNGFRRQTVAIADALATAGFATLAIDAPMHGDRSYCLSDAQCAGGAGSCDAVQHRCSQPAGYCVCSGASTSECGGSCGLIPGTGESGFDSLIGKPAISGQNFLSIYDIFATRDHFRQQIVDYGELIRSLEDTTVGLGSIDPSGGGVTAALVPTGPAYIGQSLGGILGTLITATVPELVDSVLNVPGASPVDLIEDSEPGQSFYSFRVGLDAFLASPLGGGLPAGTHGYDFFFDTARWIMDPADPQNFGRNLIDEPLPDLVADPTGQTPGPAKKVLIQWMLNDPTVVNPTTDLLFASIPEYSSTAANNTSDAAHFSVTQYINTPADPGDHGFLLDGSSDTAAGQTEAVEWVLP